MVAGRRRPNAPQDRFRGLLSHWASHSDKPVVLMLDEVNALVGDTLIFPLRQLRAGYARRPRGIHLKCNCPDRAGMCKHLAAMLYGVGALIELPSGRKDAWRM